MRRNCKKFLMFLVISSLVIGGQCFHSFAGSKDVYESLSETLDNMVEYNHCRSQDNAYGSGDGRQCDKQSRERMSRFQEEMQSRQAAREAREEKDREHKRLRDERYRELSTGPNVLDEMTTRFGNAVTYEECMTVYSERRLEEYGVMTSGDIRKACLNVVQRVKAYCANTRDAQCADKGYLRPNETAEALQQAREEASDRQREQNIARRRELREQWIRSGGQPGVCPGLQALMNKNHPCHF